MAGKDLSIIAMIGFVMLSGIIVNNGIVLVDTINQLRYKGYELMDAVITAGSMRIRPILMTAITTILGLTTMALGSWVRGRDGTADGYRNDRGTDLWNFAYINLYPLYLPGI